MNSLQQWIFSIVYILTMLCYLKVETGGSQRNRAINKVILSSLFLINSTINIFCNPIKADSIILICGIFCSWLGDVLLLNSVLRGGSSFMLANVLYLVYMVRNFYAANPTVFIIAAILYAVFMALWVYMVKSGYVKLGKMKVFSVYISVVSLQGCCGLALLGTNTSVALKILGLGLGMVMISDYLLASHYYHDKDKKLILRLNSSSYFMGMMLVSLMTYMINI